MMLTHHGTHGKLKLLHLEDGGLYLQRDYQKLLPDDTWEEMRTEPKLNAISVSAIKFRKDFQRHK
ncbi:MAG: hypothetical protein RCG16_01625 [Rickettsia hoogstraalii]